MLSRRRLLAAVPLLAPLKSAEIEAGFEPLFDGRTLAGWQVREGPSSAFYVEDGSIVVHRSSNYPTWLSTTRTFENFDLRLEFFLKGWSDSGIFFHAPEHGPPSAAGFKINIFHQRDETPKPESMGSIFPIVPPRLVNVRSQGDWNTMRVLMDWPLLRVWVNGEIVQDLDLEAHAELRHRLRSGYIGLESLSYPVRFRNLRIRPLPPKENWQVLYERPEDFSKNWFVSEGEPKFEPLGEVLYGDGSGHIATKEKFRDFELQLYVRADRFHNSGVLFRSAGQGLKGSRYEIQLHNVPEAHYPTGSLYYHKRASYPRIRDFEWFLMQLWVKGPTCLVRINGETVLEYDRLENLEAGHIELQAHRPGKWTEFKRVRIKPL
jgi:hypothetical protein